jgi:hypothetical protein
MLMEIPSALNSGLQGFQKAQETAEKAAVNIVASTTLPAAQQNITISDESSGEVSNEVSNEGSSTEIPDLNQELVNLKVAEFQAKASAEVIKSADDALGTLLDVTA